jgi:hypothetical protein
MRFLAHASQGPVGLVRMHFLRLFLHLEHAVGDLMMLFCPETSFFGAIRTRENEGKGASASHSTKTNDSLHARCHTRKFISPLTSISKLAMDKTIGTSDDRSLTVPILQLKFVLIKNDI